MRIITGSLFALLICLVLTISGCTPAETGPGTIEVMVISNIVEEGASDSEAETRISSIEATVSEIKIYRGGVVQENEGEH